MPPQRSVNGFDSVVRSRVDVVIVASWSSVVGSISRSANPSSPPHSPTIRPRESNAAVAHSETP